MNTFSKNKPNRLFGRFQKAVIIICLFVLFVSGKIAIAEALHISSTSFISAFNDKVLDSESVLFMAEGFGPYYSGYNWRYGIVGKDEKFFLYLIISDYTEDAEVLSCKLMIRNDNKYDDYLSIWKECNSVLLLGAHQDQINGQKGEDFSFVYHGRGYCDRFITEQFVFQDSPLINRIGEDAYVNVYYPASREEKDKKFQENSISFIRKYFPSINEEELDIYISKPNFLFEDEYYRDWPAEEIQKYYEKAFQEAPYLLPYNENIYLEIKRDGILNNIYLYANSDEKETTFQAYLGAFLYFSDFAYSDKVADLLLYQYGEEFSWSNYIKTSNIYYLGKQTLFFDPETKWYIQINGNDTPPSVMITGLSTMSRENDKE